MEVGVVEQGLHSQLGQPGAKTEAQLGDRQLESAKRLRHMLATNRYVCRYYRLVYRGMIGWE